MGSLKQHTGGGLKTLGGCDVVWPCSLLLGFGMTLRLEFSCNCYVNSVVWLAAEDGGVARFVACGAVGDLSYLRHIATFVGLPIA